MEILKLVDDKDTKAILKEVKKIFPEYKCKVKIGPEYDTDHNKVEIMIKIPHDRVSETTWEIIKNAEKELESKYGAAIWEWSGLCKCGEKAQINQYSDCECHACHMEEYLENRELDECRVCGKRFNQYKDGSFRTHFEIHVEKNTDKQVREGYSLSMKEGAIQKENAIRKRSFIYEIGFNIHALDLSQWECCSLQCAKKAYAEFIHKILDHPFTKECLKESEKI